MAVEHEIYLFPTREKLGIWVLPGQRITSLQQIAEGVKWSEWGRETVPNKKTIKGILDWLIYRKMVTAESNANGTLISITNWHSYNKPTPDKVTAESNAKGTRSGHKLEGIEGKEVKNKILSDFFEKIWNAYPKKDGKKQAGRHYFATVTNDTDMEQINLALGNYLNHIETNKIELKFIKNGSTWFNNWQDWRIEENGQ